MFPITTHTTQRSNNHQENVGSIRKLTMDPDGMRRENNMEALGEIQGTHGYIRVAQRQHGSRQTIIKINMVGKKLDLISISHLDDG